MRICRVPSGRNVLRHERHGLCAGVSQFAYDIDLNVLLNPAFPEREGRNLAGQHDANGHAVHDEIRAVVTTNHAGWIDAVIARPGSTVPARKRVYVVAVSMDGKPGILGSGFYPR